MNFASLYIKRVLSTITYSWYVMSLKHYIAFNLATRSSIGG